MNSDKKPLAGHPSKEFLAGYRTGLLDGIDVADDDCVDSGACPVPPLSEQRPLLAATDKDLAGQDRLAGDDRLVGDEK
jgi:hypothetical protein